MAESFFGTLKSELREGEQYAKHDTANTAITEYIEDFYNLRRRNSHYGYRSPIEFEVRALAARKAASFDCRRNRGKLKLGLSAANVL